MTKLSAILQMALLTSHIYAATETKRCNCYMLGTIEDEYSQSACDNSTGECSCLPNVDGRDCDKCKDGYFGIFSGSGCTFCACNMIGALAQKCNQRSGQCQCKDGFDGFKCEQCIDGSSMVGTTCDKDVSDHLQCEKDAKCDCDLKSIGDKCSTCNISEKDSACYNLIEPPINDFKILLKTISQTLDGIVVNEEDTDEYFMKSLNELKSRINNYLQKVSKVEPANVETVINLLTEVKTIQANFDELLKVTKEEVNIKELSKKMQQLEKLIKNTEKNISSNNSPHDSGPLKDISINAQNQAMEIEKRVAQIKKSTESLFKLADDAIKEVDKIVVEVRGNLTQFKKQVDAIESDQNKLNVDLKKEAIHVKEETENQNIRAEEIKMKALTQKVPDWDIFDEHGNIIHKIKKKVAALQIPTNGHPKVKKIMEKIGEIEAGVKHLEIARKKISSLVDEIEAFNDLANLPKDIENTHKDIAAIQKVIDDLNEAIDNHQMRKEAEKKLTELNKLYKVLDELRAKRNFLREVLENIYEELIAIMKDLIAISESYPTTEKKIREIELQLNELEEQFAQHERLKKLKLELEVDLKKIEAIANNLPDLEGACVEQTVLT